LRVALGGIERKGERERWRARRKHYEFALWNEGATCRRRRFRRAKILGARRAPRELLHAQA